LLILRCFTAVQYKWRKTRLWHQAWHSHQYETWVHSSNHVSSIKDWRICKLLLWFCVMLHFYNTWGFLVYIVSFGSISNFFISFQGKLIYNRIKWYYETNSLKLKVLKCIPLAYAIALFSHLLNRFAVTVCTAWWLLSQCSVTMSWDVCCFIVKCWWLKFIGSLWQSHIGMLAACGSLI
jgi:uncharacterized membrane protein YqhA